MTKPPPSAILTKSSARYAAQRQNGSIAQLVEHMPYKHGVTGSSPVVPTTRCGAVVQLVRTPACHAGGRGFKSLPRRHFLITYAQVAQLVEQRTENPRVAGSIPALGTICECSSSGRAPPCQGGGSEFEPRRPLQMKQELKSSCFHTVT